jgi:hypothetical protein
MNTQEQAYIQGFVKRANEYGFNDNEAISLFKQALLDPSLMGKKAPVAKPPMKPVVPKIPNPNEADMNDVAGYKKASARSLALEHNKVNVPLQTLFAGGPLSMIYNGYKDIHGDKDLAKEKDLPSRFLRINGGHLLGALVGGGLGGAAMPAFGEAAIPVGAALGGFAGGGFGAKSYNDALDELASKKR